MAGVGGAAVPGRLSLAGTEARPTELFSYKVAIKRVLFSIVGADLGVGPLVGRTRRSAPTRK
jgi:hypothetical protein